MLMTHKQKLVNTTIKDPKAHALLVFKKIFTLESFFLFTTFRSWFEESANSDESVNIVRIKIDRNQPESVGIGMKLVGLAGIG